jgi:hypothetical protein
VQFLGGTNWRNDLVNTVQALAVDQQRRPTGLLPPQWLDRIPGWDLVSGRPVERSRVQLNRARDGRQSIGYFRKSPAAGHRARRGELSLQDRQLSARLAPH